MKSALWKLVQKISLLKKPSVKYCVTHELLPSLITNIPCDVLRELLFLPKSIHVTQLNQDIFALLVNRFSRGYFIEIGANDGFTFSNTVYLEEHFGWTGLLVEANPKYIDSLSRRKNATIMSKAITEKTGSAEFVDGGLYGGLSETLDSLHSKKTDKANKFNVSCITLQEMFEEVESPHVIDFISIDVEGGELPIIRQLVRNNRRVRCGCVEVNNRYSDIVDIKNLLESSGYEVAWKGQTRHDLYFTDPNLCIK